MKIIKAIACLACVSLSFSRAYSAGFNKVHLFDPKCEAEAEKGLETTPQSPPLDVDDPGTPGCNKWEVNVLVDGDITKNDKSWDLPLLDINYGIGSNLQLKYEVPNVTDQTEQSSVSGVGNSKAGVKDMFFADEESSLEMAFYPQVEFITPNSGAVDKGLVNPGNIVTLPILLSKKIGETPKGDINLSANLGYNFSSVTDKMDYISAALGIGLPVISTVAIMGELSTEQALQQNSDGVRDQLVKANLGLLGKVNKQFLVYTSYGASLYDSDSEKHNYFLAGIRLLTGTN